VVSDLVLAGAGLSSDKQASVESVRTLSMANCQSCRKRRLHHP
jgi:hypothetical protein